ncbi:MAG TPA: hypothetical protein PKD61_23170, partial [Polyangiaceae bacterium]|nr:hypothetical protein [Polyangiaceae bacterium]
MVAKRAAGVAAGLMAVACGTPAATPASGGRPWDAMGPAERLEYMQSTVMPRMQAVFEAFDEHRFGDVTCATCHRGRAAADGGGRSRRAARRSYRWRAGARRGWGWGAGDSPRPR